MNRNLINPYKLFGISYNISSNTDIDARKKTIYKLKRAYYNLALLTHPDKGGSGDDMCIITKAYNYINRDLNNIKDVTYEQLEEEFEEFCKEQTNKVQPFSSIYEETNEWIDDFNREFEKQKIKINTDSQNNHQSGTNMADDVSQLHNDNNNNNYNDNHNDNYNPYEVNPFNSGYGDLMDSNNYDINSNAYINHIHLSNIALIRDRDTTNNQGPKNPFKKQIIIYEEPQYLPDTTIHYPLERKEINDYSKLSGNIKMCDYKLAFEPPDNEFTVQDIINSNSNSNSN